MVKKCAIPGCKSESYAGCGISFFKLPSDDINKENWLKLIPRARTHWTKHSRICSKHFSSDCFVHDMKWRRLKPDAIPSLFLGHKPETLADDSDDDDSNDDDRNEDDRNDDDRNDDDRNDGDRNDGDRNVGDRNVGDRHVDDRIHGFCRCCLALGQHMQLSQEHSETLMNLNIFLLQDPRLANLVCASCVASMAMVEEFKRKVVDSETRLVQGLANSLQQPQQAREIGATSPKDPLMLNEVEMEIKNEIREIEESEDTLTLLKIRDGQTLGDQILPVQTEAKEILPTQISTVQTLPVQTNRNQLVVRKGLKVQTLTVPSTSDQTLIVQIKNDQDFKNRIQTKANQILPNQISTVQTLPVQTNRNQLPVKRRKVQTLIGPPTNDQTLIGQSKNDQDLNNMDIEEMLVPNFITDKIPLVKTKLHEMYVKMTTGNRTILKKVLVDVPPEKISKGAIPVICQRELKNIAMSSQNMVNIKLPTTSRAQLGQTPLGVKTLDTRARPVQTISKQSPVNKNLIDQREKSNGSKTQKGGPSS